MQLNVCIRLLLFKKKIRNMEMLNIFGQRFMQERKNFPVNENNEKKTYRSHVLLSVPTSTPLSRYISLADSGAFVQQVALTEHTNAQNSRWEQHDNLHPFSGPSINAAAASCLPPLFWKVWRIWRFYLFNVLVIVLCTFTRRI